MRLFELLMEKKVESTWISDIIHNRPNKVLTMKLSNGKVFTIPGINRGMFEKWSRATSKGKFWHQFIKGNYRATRIK